MAAVFMNGNSLHAPDDASQPASQASSPSSPAATFMLQQGQTTLPAFSLSTAGYSDGQSQPSTPTSMHTNVSLDPPPSVTFAEYLRAWGDAHVAAWLASIKCPHHSPVFRTNDIRGDVLLELDQTTLKEMGVFTVGDRIRIVAGVKALRQKCSSHATALNSITNRPRLQEHGRNSSLSSDSGSSSSPSTRHAGARRLDNGRPAPLHLTPNTGSDSLPRLVRDGQDSARPPPPIRPLPQPTNNSSSVHTPSGRHGLPPLPPPPRSQPPPPPSNSRSTPRTLLPPTGQLSGRRTPTLPEPPAFNTSQPLPLPPAPNSLLVDRQTPGGARPVRSPSPLQNSQLPSRNINRSPNENHARASSLSGSSSSPAKPPVRSNTGTGAHPYALQHGAAQQAALSPIAEAFNASHRGASSSTPSPPTSHAGASFRSANRPNTPSSHTPSLDDIRKKVIKFSMPEEGKSSMIQVWDCGGGAEILWRAMKKLRGSEDSSHSPNVELIEGALTVDGWGVFADISGDRKYNSELQPWLQSDYRTLSSRFSLVGSAVVVYLSCISRRPGPRAWAHPPSSKASKSQPNQPIPRCFPQGFWQH